jgi:thiol-disulfide isomerase/thioredoxin
MTFNTRSVWAVHLWTALTLVTVAAPVTGRAENTSDSIAAVQAVLPDSLSLKDRVVYVDFWASWCGPCRLSFPWMQGLYTRHRQKGLEIVAVCMDKDRKAALAFIKENKATFPVVFDSTGALAKRFNLEAMPTSFLYGRDGRLVSKHLGFDKDKTDSLETVMVQLLDRSKSK